MSGHGDINLGDTIDVKFTTARGGVPTTLAGTPAVAAYVGNGLVEITAGVTLSVDFDSRTGLNNVRVVASSGNGFAAGTNVMIVVTAGTVDGVSVVGYVVGSFSIANRSALRPTTAGRTLTIEADGMAHADVKEWLGVAPLALASQRLQVEVDAYDAALDFNATQKASINAEVDSALDTAVPGVPTAGSINERIKTMDDADIPGRLPAALISGKLDTLSNSTLTGTASAGSATTITLTGGVASDDFYNGQLVQILAGTGAGQARTILDFVGATLIATVTRDWTTPPDGTSVFAVSAGDVPAILEAGTAQAGGPSQITLDAGASATTGIYKSNYIVLTGGLGVGQTRLITAYNGATKVATVVPNWTTTPNATTVYQIVPGGQVNVGEWLGEVAVLSAGNLPSVNVAEINGGATNGNNATLSLKALNITNNAGHAILAQSTGGNGRGIYAIGNGNGHGIQAEGDLTGHGIYAVAGITSGSGIVGESQAAGATNYGMRLLTAGGASRALGVVDGIDGDLLGSVASVATAGISSTSFAAGAIDAAALATDAAAEIRDSVWAKVVETQGSITAQQVMSLLAAACFGVTADSGATFKTPNGLATRISATYNLTQERLTITLTPSA